MLLFPTRLATVRFLRTHADYPSTVLMKTKLDGPAAPTEYPLRLAGIAIAIFQRHLRLESTSRRSRHVGTRQSEVFHLRGEQGQRDRFGLGGHKRTRCVNLLGTLRRVANPATR